MDNTTGNSAMTETDPGVIAYLQVRNTPITANEVTTSPATICEVVSAPDCANAPPAATYESILCRLDALLTRVRAAASLGVFPSKSAANVERAKSLTIEARTLGRAKKARQRLQQAAKAVGGYVSRLRSLTARKTLKGVEMIRLDFVDAGQTIKPDLVTLRSQP